MLGAAVLLAGCDGDHPALPATGLWSVSITPTLWLDTDERTLTVDFRNGNLVLQDNVSPGAGDYLRGIIELTHP